MFFACIKVKNEIERRMFMTYIILASHGDLAGGMLNSVHLLAGPQKDISILMLKPGNSLEVFAKKLSSKIQEKLQDYDHVLVLTDLFGGSPSNSAIIAMKNLSFQCITGINLPMTLEAVLDRNQNIKFDEYIQKIKNAGRNGVIDLNKKLALN